MMVEFRPFGPADIIALDVQESQIGQFGIFEPIRDLEHGAQLQASGPAWTAIGEDGVMLICAGFVEVFGDRQATAWALISREYLCRRSSQAAILRYSRERVAAAPYRRIEALCRLGNNKEEHWLSAIGFDCHDQPLRNWGPKSEDYLLYERIR